MPQRDRGCTRSPVKSILRTRTRWRDSAGRGLFLFIQAFLQASTVTAPLKAIL
jgi:hypothetical protein